MFRNADFNTHVEMPTMHVARVQQYDTKLYNKILKTHLERGNARILSNREIRALNLNRGTCKLGMNCAPFFHGLTRWEWVRPQVISYESHHASVFRFNENRTFLTVFGKSFLSFYNNQAQVFSLCGLQLTHFLNSLTRLTAKCTVGLQDLGWKLDVLRQVIDRYLTLGFGLHWDWSRGFTISSELNRAIFETGNTNLRLQFNEMGDDGIHMALRLPTSDSHHVTTEFDFGIDYGLGFSGESAIQDRRSTFWALKANVTDSFLAEFGTFYCPEPLMEDVQTKYLIAYTSSLTLGVGLRLGYFRESTGFTIPLILSPNHSIFTNLAAMCVPGAMYGVLHLLHKYKWSKEEEKKESDQKEQDEATLAKLKEHALCQQTSMELESQKNASNEREKDGLVILKAIFGPKDGDQFDVTIACQYLVKRSHLRLPSGSKTSLPGFYGDDDSELTIDYIFEGQRYQCRIKDELPVLIPSEAHRLFRAIE